MTADSRPGCLVVLLALSACCCPAPPSPSSSPRPPPPSPRSPEVSREESRPKDVVQTGPISIWEAYQRNEVGADNQFRDRRLKLGALVRDIRKDALNSIVVELATSPAGGAIHARFANEWAQEVGQLERGQLVSLECTGRGLVLGTPQLADCGVVWRQPSPAKDFALLVAASYELCLIEATLPKLLAVLDAGALPDGGPVPKGALKFLANAEIAKRDSVAALERTRADRLPCDHAALAFLHTCDGTDRKTVPVCGSSFLAETWKHIHKE